jgi:hypothetical protein
VGSALKQDHERVVSYRKRSRGEAVNLEIPKLTEFGHQENAPGWFQPAQEGQSLKPVIRCNCGQFCGLALHHVHADGMVTASFYHKRGTNYAVGESLEGCEWHVFLTLKDYAGGDFPPVR